MGHTVADCRMPFKKTTVASVCVWLHEAYGESPQTWENRMYGDGSDYRQVARINAALLRFGLTDKVAELNAVIDASLMGEVPSLPEAIHQHNLRDATEDLAQAEFIHHAGDAELEGWIRKLAGDLHAGEVLLCALITERDARRQA